MKTSKNGGTALTFKTSRYTKIEKYSNISTTLIENNVPILKKH